MPEELYYFRPSLVIFVGKVGQEIRRQFISEKSGLLSYIDRPLRQAIGLIQFPSEDYDGSVLNSDEIPAHFWLVRDMFQDTSQFGMEADGHFHVRPNQKEPLKQVFWNALTREVQAALRLQNIDFARFTILERQPQIYIVGDVTSEWMGYALQVVHEQVVKAGMRTEVCYVLSRFEPGYGVTVDWTESGDWDKRALANFNFIYENAKRPSNRFLTPEESYYAAAEALFALVTTGITTQDPYKDVMKLTPNQRIYNAVGNLCSSLIIFPYAQVLRFCSAYLGAELMDEWLEDIIQSKVSDPERQRQQSRARESVAGIHQWIEDTEPRPGTEAVREQMQSLRSSRRGGVQSGAAKVLLWPTLSILRRAERRSDAQQQRERILLEHERDEDRARREERERQEEYDQQENLNQAKRLTDQTQELFALFSYKEVRKESRAHRAGPEVWANIALRRSGTAVNKFNEWNLTATQAWRMAGQRVSNDFQSTVDRIWPASNNGLELARIYVDDYDDRLAELANLLSVWRKTHKENYQALLGEFDRLARGPWVTTEDESNITNSQGPNSGSQARPIGAQRGISATSGPPQGQGQQQGGGQQPASLEEDIARRLKQRLSWEYSRIPHRRNLAAAGVMGIPALVLSLLALAPALAVAPLASLLLILVVVALAALGSWLYYRYRRRDLVRIEKELLRFYSCCIAYRCEQREDQLRVSALVPLRLRVQRMRERLDDMVGFVTQVSNKLEELAHEVHDDLFTSRNPAAVHDVYVGNGTLLEQTEWPPVMPNATPAMIRRRRIERRARKKNKLSDTRAERMRRIESHAVNTLEDFAERIHGKRLSAREQKQPWHHPAALKAVLLRSFQSRTQSILEMDLEQAVQYVNQFTEGVVDSYMTDSDLVEIAPALDWEETWGKVFERMENPVYRSLGGSLSPELVFICGRRQDMDRGEQIIHQRQRGAIPVYTRNPDWLLVAGFFRDKAPAELDVDLLFPHS